MRNTSNHSAETSYVLNGIYDDPKVWRNWYLERGCTLRTNHIGLPNMRMIIRWGVDSKEYIIIELL